MGNMSAITLSPERMFDSCRNVDDKLYRLADAFADTYVWRVEEAEELASLKRRIAMLERQKTPANPEPAQPGPGQKGKW